MLWEEGLACSGTVKEQLQWLCRDIHIGMTEGQDLKHNHNLNYSANYPTGIHTLKTKQEGAFVLKDNFDI